MSRSCRWVPVVALALLLPAQAHAFKLLGGHWAVEEGPVEYTVSATGSDNIADDSDTQAIIRSFQTWECVLCSNVQFRYMGDGPNEVATDGKNAMFFLEDATAWQDQTGASLDVTLGVTIHFDLETYSEADIAFNGAGFDWSTDEQITNVDVESVSLHETGHFAGLGHPCTDEAETDCLPDNVAIMAPAWSGGNARTPLDDDTAGLCAVYTTPKTACSGKKRLKEECERDCDCETGLLCVPDGDKRMCSRPCGTGLLACPRGTGCVLGLDGQGDRGLCLRNPEGSTQRMDGASCSRDLECVAGSCRRSGVLNRNVCAHSCNADDQCSPGYRCSDNLCLIPSAGEGVPCPPDTEERPRFLPPGCVCRATGPEALGVWVAVLLMWRRRIRQRS
ncbi:MAG: matrixin family metalloprotease [Deltaproteobacteria bacterium]|nr:matrixin family metalloprotease [Deltaproteobacteria bacterium]